MRVFVKLSSSLVTIFAISSNKLDGKRNTGKFFLEIIFISSFSTSSVQFSEFDSGNVILFQIQVSGRNIKETPLAKYFLKVAACPSFT